MDIKKLTEEDKVAILERGPVSDLVLYEEDLEGLQSQERLSMVRRVNFLRTFARRGLKTEGARAAGVSLSIVTHWLKTSEWFRLLYDEALEEAKDAIEGEAMRRAVDGHDEPVFYKGTPVFTTDDNGQKHMLTTKKYSDNIMIALLKGARPEKYKDNYGPQINNNAGGVLIVPSAIDHATWAQEAQKQQAKFVVSAPDDSVIAHG